MTHRHPRGPLVIVTERAFARTKSTQARLSLPRSARQHVATFAAKAFLSPHIPFPRPGPRVLSVGGRMSLAPSFDVCLRQCGSGDPDRSIAQYCRTSVKNSAPK